jgi:hypothetical protein
MRWGYPYLVKFGSKLALEVFPSVLATLIGGYLLTQLHWGRIIEKERTVTVTSAPADQAPTAREERALMRDVLKARRESTEEPEQVRPKAASHAATAEVPKKDEPRKEEARKDEPKQDEPKNQATRPARAATATYAPAPPPPRKDSELSRVRPEPPAPALVMPLPSSPTLAPPASAITPRAAAAGQPAQPTPLSPVVVNAAPPPATPADVPPRRPGVAGAVFSTLSGFVGQAANATGETVNWVIDLPGKAVSAGGRMIGVTPPPAPPPPPSRSLSGADG